MRENCTSGSAGGAGRNPSPIPIKRAQAAKLSARHPICLDLLRAGKISLTSINIAAAKITDKNSVEIFKAMQEKSNQDLKFYLSTIDENGKPKKDAQETMEVKLLMTKACHQKWLKAKALVSHNKKQIDNGAALESILDQYLERHDPLKKAERASKRNTDKRTSGHVTVGNAPAKRYISKSLYHQVMLKDEGQCSFVDEVGKRCCEQRYLEVDHKKLFSRNQEHKLENLQILCSSHNRLLAERELSVNFIRDKISGAK